RPDGPSSADLRGPGPPRFRTRRTDPAALRGFACGVQEERVPRNSGCVEDKDRTGMAPLLRRVGLSDVRGTVKDASNPPASTGVSHRTEARRRTPTHGMAHTPGDGVMADKIEEHQRLIVDQFTKQAVPFSQMPDRSPELILAASEVGPTDTVLDVACGPG